MRKEGASTTSPPRFLTALCANCIAPKRAAVSCQMRTLLLLDDGDLAPLCATLSQHVQVSPRDLAMQLQRQRIGPSPMAA